MQQHPIPQNVTQYQFRLVGDMTLKQFLELAGGLVLAYLFFASNLIFIVKWPLVILSILFGAGLAFFPVEDRPLDQWITAFVKAIYRPTRFTWQKTNKIPGLFLFTARAQGAVNTITKTIKAPNINHSPAPLSDLSDQEASIVKSLDSIFTSLPQITQTQGAVMSEDVSRPSIVVRKLKPATEVSGVTPHPVVANPTDSATPTIMVVPTPAPSTNVVFAAPSAPKATVRATAPIPKNITLPAPPKTPNLITGVVVDQGGKLVENAIVQIVSSDGIPQRAMKTNSLGQFYTSTPLTPSSYIIEVDRMGLTFAPQSLVVNNTILSPIELQASN
ncbi:MAG: PrgI family protein [Microgenomates group bacterium]